jgi:hypothetical protein
MHFSITILCSVLKLQSSYSLYHLRTSPNCRAAIQNKFCNYKLFSFAEVFTFLQESEDIQNLTVYAINNILPDLTHIGVFRKISNETEIHYDSSFSNSKKNLLNS